MAVVDLSIAKPSGLGISLRTLFREIPRQVHLALGVKGVGWVMAASAVGLVSCLAAFYDVAVSVKRSDVEYRKVHAAEIFDLDNSYRRLLRHVVASMNNWETAADRNSSPDAWSGFERVLAATCAGAAPAERQPRLVALCLNSSPAFFAPLRAEIDQSSLEKRRPSSGVLKAMFSFRDELNEICREAVGGVDSLFGRMMDEYERALAVLLISTIGFVSAGGVLMFLIGHASMKHHAQTEAAEGSAAKATRSAELLEETVEALPAGVVLYDQDDRLMLFNSTASKITPILQNPGVIGKTYAELVEIHMAYRARKSSMPADDDPGDLISDFASDGAQRLRRADGGRWFEWSEHRTKSGRKVGLRTDVTALKAHEIEIARIRDEFESLVAALADVVFSLDLKSGKLTFVSAAARELFEIPTATLMAGRLLDFVSSEDRERLQNIARSELASAERPIRQVKFRIKTGGGQEKHVEARFRRMPGDAATVAGILRDIEAQTWLADRLEAERTRLRSIVESSGALVLLADRDLSIVMVNSEFVDLTGIGLDAAIGKSMQDIVDWPIGSDQFENWRQGRRNEDDLTTARFTWRHLDPAGRERIFNITAKPIINDRGEAQQFVFVGVDDTDRRDVEQALFATERLAAVGEMSAAVAHEIAQPLQVINLACHSALDELAVHADQKALDVAYIRQKLERIAAQIERSNRIVGDLRAFVRGASADEMHPFDPAEAARCAIDLTSHGLQQARIRLTVSLDESGRKVLGHVSKLEQVLVNLINNARDSGGSNIDVMLVVERHESGADKVRITVQDNGPGISPQVLHRLFNAFITTKPRGKGTGLGLRVCRRIVEEMRGAISGDNRAEGGARFQVVLPVAADQLS